MTRPARSSRAALATAMAGTVVVAAYAALAAVQMLVLNPLAAVPGRTLSQIHAEMAAAGESPGTAGVLVVLGVGVALAVAGVVVVRRGAAATATVAIGYLVLLALGAPAYFLASFGPGVSLADTYFISGGDHAPWAKPLYAVSLVALVAIAFLTVGRLARRTAPTT